LGRHDPDGIEDALVDLLMLAQGTVVIGSYGSSFSSVAALFNNVDLHIVDTETQGSMSDEGCGQAVFREVPCCAKDPSEDLGQYFLVGSWDNWEQFKLLEPDLHEENTYQVIVEVREELGMEEFQIIQDRDWEQRFCPSFDCLEIIGPTDKDGLNFVVQVPASCKWLQVLWDPRGNKRCRWMFLNCDGQDLLEGPQDFYSVGRQSLDTTSGPFYVLGSWDGYTDFRELKMACNKDHKPTYCARIELRNLCTAQRFVITQYRDTKRRFYPVTGKQAILGPNDDSEASWGIRLPSGCAWLEINWDPSGARKCEWKYLSDYFAVIG